MPAALVGVVAGVLGTAAGVAATTAMVYGAIAGAVVSAVTNKGNMLKNAVKGALSGAAGAGLASAGMGMAGATGTANTAVELSPLEAAVELSPLEAAGGIDAGQATAGSQLSAVEASGGIDAATKAGEAAKAGGTVKTLTPPAEAPKGLLERAINWIETKPETAKILGQGAAGAAKSFIDKETSQAQIEALMERDRLNREALKVGGLAGLSKEPAIPRVGGFLDKPQWQLDPMTGLLQKREATA